MMDSDEINQYFIWNEQGLIPGPGESEGDFRRRAEYCLQLIKELDPEFEHHFPFPKADQTIGKAVVEEACVLTQKSYGICPEWVPLFFSNYKLAPWHGGCAWIFQVREDSPTAAILQMRRSWRDKATHLGVYKREELVAHELCHVGRMMFHERKFEEILAYQTSSAGWQRYFGPIIGSAHEAMMFMSFLILILLADLFIVFTESPALYTALWWLKLVPVAMVAYGLVRLWRKHRTYHSCLEMLQPVVKSPAAVAYRLTDEEIHLFARSAPKAIQAYAERRSEQELRWRVIRGAYF